MMQARSATSGAAEWKCCARSMWRCATRAMGHAPGRISDENIEQGADWFRIEFTSTHRQGEIAFAWEGYIEGKQDGTIRFAMCGQGGFVFSRKSHRFLRAPSHRWLRGTRLHRGAYFGHPRVHALSRTGFAPSTVPRCPRDLPRGASGPDCPGAVWRAMCSKPRTIATGPTIPSRLTPGP